MPSCRRGAAQTATSRSPFPPSCRLFSSSSRCPCSASAPARSRSQLQLRRQKHRAHQKSGKVYPFPLSRLHIADDRPLFLCAAPFVSLFTSTPEIAEKSVWGIRVFMIGAIPLSLPYAFVDGLTGLGFPQYAIIVSLTRKIVVYLGCTFLSPRFGAYRPHFTRSPPQTSPARSSPSSCFRSSSRASSEGGRTPEACSMRLPAMIILNR